VDVLIVYVLCGLCRPENNCLDELSIIAAMLSTEEIFHYPKRGGGGGRGRNGSGNGNGNGRSSRQQQDEEAERNAVSDAHDRLRHAKGDHFTYLKIFKKYEAEGGYYEDDLICHSRTALFVDICSELLF
jgi:hypothetical protein